MKKTKFKYGWFEKRRFSSERKRQLKEGSERYSEVIDKSCDSYWNITQPLPEVDDDQQSVLSGFSESLVTRK